MSDEVRSCWACQSELSESQAICLKCNNWQNWRRYLIISQTSIAFIVLALSLLTTIYTTTNLFKQKYFITSVSNFQFETADLNFINEKATHVVIKEAINCVFALSLDYSSDENVNVKMNYVIRGLDGFDSTIASNSNFSKEFKIEFMDAYFAELEPIIENLDGGTTIKSLIELENQIANNNFFAVKGVIDATWLEINFLSDPAKECYSTIELPSKIQTKEYFSFGEFRQFIKDVIYSSIEKRTAK